MNISDTKISDHCIVIAALCTFFIIYPNIMWIPWNVQSMSHVDLVRFWVTFAFRTAYFFLLFLLQIKGNDNILRSEKFFGRFWKNLIFTIIAVLIFFAISALIPMLGVQSGAISKHLTFQFLVECLLCTFIGYISDMNMARVRREREMEQLKIENLESRCAALSNQVNPHFFFNSLNGISSLVQRGDEDTTLDYISRLSDIFRYILNSGNQGLVSLEEELRFVDSFAYVMQLRFGGKLQFFIDVTEEYRSMKLPVLSMLPLLENVSVHNRIDSSHQMVVRIYYQNNAVLVENSVCPKSTELETHGIGLSNLDNRFRLMTGNGIKVNCVDSIFTVTLPLTSSQS